MEAMDTTFRYSSANDITEEFIEKLKSFYNGKPVSITVTEDFQIPTDNGSLIPENFITELQERQKEYENGKVQGLSWDDCKKELLERVNK